MARDFVDLEALNGGRYVVFGDLVRRNVVDVIEHVLSKTIGNGLGMFFALEFAHGSQRATDMRDFASMIGVYNDNSR